MSSENATYYSRSMSAIVEISDGTTEISNGNITCDSITANTILTNSFSTDSFNATTLTDSIAFICGGNITNLNNFSSNNINSSTQLLVIHNKHIRGNKFISRKRIMSGEIKWSNLAGSQNVFTGNMYPIYLGGSGGVLLARHQHTQILI